MLIVASCPGAESLANLNSSWVFSKKDAVPCIVKEAVPFTLVEVLAIADPVGGVKLKPTVLGPPVDTKTEAVYIVLTLGVSPKVYIPEDVLK